MRLNLSREYRKEQIDSVHSLVEFLQAATEESEARREGYIEGPRE